MSKLIVMSVGVEDPVLTFMKEVNDNLEIKKTTQEQILEFSKNTPDSMPHLIFCGPLITHMSLQEVAQLLRFTCFGIPLLFISNMRSENERSNLLKNGFMDVFVLTVDKDIIREKILEILGKSEITKTYRSVKLVDIQADQVLNFDTTLFLPTNNKYLRYTKSGNPISKDQSDRLSKFKVNSIFVSQDQIDSFYQYTANRLKELSSGNPIGATERRDRLQTAVRELISGMLGDPTKEGTLDQGRTIVQDCQKIIEHYIIDTDAGDWYKRVMDIVGDSSNAYSHSTNVSTFASLFSLGVGIG